MFKFVSNFACGNTSLKIYVKQQLPLCVFDLTCANFGHVIETKKC